MGRVIPEDRPLSDEDREFLLGRSMRSLVETIDRAYPPEGGSEPVDGSDSDSDGDDDSVDVDEDISDFVEGLQNIDAVKEWLDTVEVDHSDVHKRDELNSLLAIELQERRDRGEEVKLDA